MRRVNLPVASAREECDLSRPGRHSTKFDGNFFLVDLTNAQISSALLYPSNYWSGPQVTFSFPTAGSTWSGYSAGQEPFSADYAGLSASQQATLRTEIGVWDKLINISLVETTDPGQIRVAFTDVGAITNDDSWGYAYSPPNRGGVGSAKSGDIWIDGDKHANSTFAPIGYDYMAAMHELGHALGLKHTFEDGDALPAAYDNYRYSIMSYTTNTDYLWVTISSNGGAVQGARTGVYPTTPMLFDVVAIQARYGADPTTFAGDTTYSFDQSKPMMQTIYDAGGNDTLDLSAHTRGSIVDLTPGAYSSIAHFTAAEQAAYYKSFIGGANSYIDNLYNDSRVYTWTDNLALSFNTTIENAKGGSAADSITGNDVANNLSGGAGNDTLIGGAGDDYLRGDDGDDNILGGTGFDDINGNRGDDTAHGGEGHDWVVGGQGDDLLLGENGNDIVYGNLGADTLFGGAGDDWIRGGQGDDTLYGEAGADFLSGDRGNDIINGGAGADRFNLIVGAGIDRITDFSSAEGDRVTIEGGAVYTLSFVGGETIISTNNGDMMILNGVGSADALGNWLA